MRYVFLAILLLTLAAGSTGCGPDRAPPAPGPDSETAGHDERDHLGSEGAGRLVSLGQGEAHLQIAVGAGLVTVRVLDAHLVPIPAEDVSLNLLTPRGPVQVNGTLVDPDESEWHLESTALGGELLGGRYLVRIEKCVYIPDFEVPEGHVASVEGPRGGTLVAIMDGEALSGHAEVRFHAEFGELEVWLGTDASMSSPLDVPVATVLMLRTATGDSAGTRLAVRDPERNEDEEGNVNVRDGATNYFVYPTDYSEEPSPPVGASGDTPVFIEFEAGGKTYRTSEFELVP